MDDLVTYKILKKDLETGEEFTGLDEIAFTSDPAIIVKGMAFNAQKKLVFKDEPKMRIVAPAMIPMEIYRNQDGEEFNVEFTAEQIELIHTEIMQLVAKGESLFNFEHDKSQKVPAYILEAWIVDNPETDKAKTTYGIDVPKGTLMLTTQITDRKYYDELVENGQIGYSIGGSFGLKLSKQLNTNTMSLPEGTQLTEGKQYIFSNGVLTEVTVELSETTEIVEEEVKEEETEMASDTTETTEEVVEEKETEMAEETATEDAPAETITEEKVASMIEERMGEVLNMLAELKAAIEEAKQEEAMDEEEEQAPVQLSVHERLAKFSASFKTK
jgi:hypothetical protein